MRVIKNWPRPVNLRKLISFLGVGSYYRKFIKGYAAIVEQLTKLTRTGIGKERCQGEGVRGWEFRGIKSVKRQC